MLDLEKMRTAELIDFVSKGRAEMAASAAAAERDDHDVQSAVAAAS